MVNTPEISEKTGGVIPWLFALFRSVFFGVILYFINEGFPVGTPLWLLIVSGVLGIVTATGLASSQLKSRGFFSALGLLLLVSGGLLALLSRFPFPGKSESLFFFSLASHLKIIVLLFVILSASTWAQIRNLHAATGELFIFILFVAYLLSGHREFQLDRPHIINTLAWDLNIFPQALLTIISTILVLVTIAYFYLTYLVTQRASRSTVTDSIPRTLSERLSKTLLMVAGVLAVVFAVSLSFYERYQTLSSARLTNGVGEAEGTGSSPLSFHSSLGATSQPAAIVRLESDYTANPFLPLLYFRESSLSKIGKREMEVASGEFDRDIPRITPTQRYVADTLPLLNESQRVTLSVYLINQHKNPFTIGVPLSYTPIKNPEPARFKQTYKTVSLAPAYELKSLRSKTVGNPFWTKQEWEHYLEPHSDSRYWEFAKKITADINETDKVAQAATIITFLSKASTYTLQPNHEVTASEDPVAPFLFGDLRGYCVHFAHATVYMLRALGIPARIGTGYLSDFSQAKDGHILLRQSDRHAWAEVHIEGAGWVPFDTQPENVESHADTQVDANLLEELMRLLEPSEEILPDIDPKKEPGFEEPKNWNLPESETMVLFLIPLVLLCLGGKLYIRFGYLLPGSPRNRLRRLYVHCASLLVDLGVPRQQGETRCEYLKRGSKYLKSEASQLTPYLLAAEYSAHSHVRIPKTIPRAGLLNRQLTWHQKVLAAINFSSLTAALKRRF